MNTEFTNYYNNFLTIYEKYYKLFKNQILNQDISNTLKSYLFYTPDSKGKLLRSFLAYRSCEIFEIPSPIKEHLAIAIELFQSFSLIHDDLPSLDNDDIRRGQKSLHKVVGEANAILIGDALAILPFLLFSKIDEINLSRKYYKGILNLITKFSEFSVISLIDGQIEDINLQKEKVKNKYIKDKLLKIYEKKTASFFGISLGCGALINSNEAQYIELYKAGVNFGLAFQLIDDIEDFENKKDELSFARIFGLEETKKDLERYVEKSLKIIKKYDEKILYTFLLNFVSRFYN